jgi:hypothetical protein
MTRKLPLFCLIAALCTGAAFAQVAYVYVSTTDGTYAYDASSTGKLTPIKGSPFQTTGGMVGTNGKFFATVGTDYVFSYEVASNGAIGKQVSEIDTQKYTGVACGTANGVALDHTGEYVYVSLTGATEDDGTSGVCDAVQTFSVGKTGTLTFKGATEFDDPDRFAGSDTIPTITGNDKFAYNTQPVGDSCQVSINAFSRESSGTLENISFSETDPIVRPVVWAGYLPTPFMTDDPTDHLAIVVYPTINGPCGPTGPFQLASYTVNSEGDIASTNTYENMPTVPDGVNSMKMDPTGKYLAVSTGTGVQWFHFNGAKPITSFTGIIGTSGQIIQMAWAGEQLYALNSSGKLHVYNVTSTSVKEASGSPTVIPIGPFTVRPK